MEIAPCSGTFRVVMLWRFVFLLILAPACLLNSQAQVVGHLPEFLPRYKLVAKFSGGMVDQNGQTVLLQNYQGAVELFDLASKTLSHLGTNFETVAYLIPNGFLAYSTNGLLQIEGDNVINLGQAYLNMPDYGRRVVEGRFGILHTSEGRVLRDFVARTNLLLSTNDGFVDVSANGSVVFTDRSNETNLAVRWYNNARFETLAILSQFPLPHVATDGTNVLWSEPQYPFGSIFLQTPTARLELSTNTFLSDTGWQPSPPRMSAVAMKNGWTIFPRWEPNNPGTLGNLWRRSPSGEITQLTTKPGFVLAMAEDGGAIIQGGDGRIQSGLYYHSPTGESKPLGDTFQLAQYFAAAGKFYAYSPLQSGGSGLFEIEIESDPFGLIYPTYNSDTGKFSAGILLGLPGTYILERTHDFVHWDQVEPITTEGISSQIEVTTPPGFFRLRKQ